MTIARVNTAKAGADGAGATNPLTTGAFSSTTGNLIAVFVRSFNTNTVSSVTDTAGNTYTARATGPNADPSMYIYTAENITGNAANKVTVTLSASVDFWWVYALEYTGLLTSGATDIASSAATGTGVTDLVSNSFSTAQASEVVLVAVSQNTLTTYTVGTDFTLVDGQIPNAPAGNKFGGVEEFITTSALSSYTAHITSAAANPYNMAVLSLKAAGGATFQPAWAVRSSIGFSGSPG